MEPVAYDRFWTQRINKENTLLLQAGSKGSESKTEYAESEVSRTDETHVKFDKSDNCSE